MIRGECTGMSTASHRREPRTPFTMFGTGTATCRSDSLLQLPLCPCSSVCRQHCSRCVRHPQHRLWILFILCMRRRYLLRQRFQIPQTWSIYLFMSLVVSCVWEGVRCLCECVCVCVCACVRVRFQSLELQGIIWYRCGVRCVQFHNEGEGCSLTRGISELIVEGFS